MKKLNLTMCQYNVAVMLLNSLTQKQIGERLGMNLKNVKFHIGNIYRITECKNRLEFIFKFCDVEPKYERFKVRRRRRPRRPYMWEKELPPVETFIETVPNPSEILLPVGSQT